MSRFSDFREKLKVKRSKHKKEEKRYNYEKIHLRRDEKNGKIGIYLVTDYSRTSKRATKAWAIHKYRHRDINISNPNNTIDYTIQVSPSGYFGQMLYDKSEDSNRYGKIYYFPYVLKQLTGLEPQKNGYTMSELLELENKINSEKENARYGEVDLIKYADNYSGKRVLDGLHIVTLYKFNNQKWRENIKCLEDKNLIIKMKDNGTLAIIRNNNQEIIAPENFDIVHLEKICRPRSTRYFDLGGYTVDSIRKIISDREKEKQEQEIED